MAQSSADPLIAASTSTSTLALTDLQQGAVPLSLYLLAPSPRALERLHPVYRVIVDVAMARLMDLNYMGSFLVARAALPHLKQRPHGHLLFVSSIVVPTSRGTVVIPLHEIDWIEAADYYSRVWSNGRSYLMRESLDALEKKVGGDGFARAHRKALVRIGGVRELRRTSDGLLLAILGNGARIPVSRRRRSAFAAAVSRRASA